MREMPETEADFIEPKDELTVQDILDEAQAQTVEYHTILEVWREVLKPAIEERRKKITPQWANRICSSYRDITFSDMPAFKDSYFNKIDELRAILDNEIASDDECLNQTSAEEDVEHNGPHYLNVLIDWQKAFLYWELAWECTDPYAATELAAISEIHRMMFDNTGLTSLLDNIQFEFTDGDRELLATVLQGLQAAAQEE